MISQDPGPQGPDQIKKEATSGKQQATKRTQLNDKLKTESEK